MEVTPTSRKGTLGSWWFHWSTGWVGHSADNEPYVGDGTRLWANHGSWGVCESALEPHQTGKAQGRKTKTPNRTMGNPAVRDYRGASGNVVMAEMGTHPATERARLVTLCAGINRHEVENARVLRARISDPLGPEFCVGHREVHDEA